MNRISPQNWYRQQKMGDGITLIDEPYIKAFYRCNIWHVRGRDKDLLVDSGMGVVSLRQWVPIVSGRPLDAVVSHTHFDHIGNQHEFDSRLCHHAEAHILAHPTRENTLVESYVSDDIFDALPPEPYHSTTYSIKAAPATRILQDGDRIDLGDRVFEVLHVPGHSPGGIALWEEKTGILIAGDAVYDGPLLADSYHANLTDYIISMERLMRLPVRIVHGGHFPSFSGKKLLKIGNAWLKENKV